MKYQTQHNCRTGFTLVEMLVSLALFTIVSTVTVGALLSLIGGNQRLVKEQTLTSAAIFSLDNMTREIRMGNYYYCGDDDTISNLRNDIEKYLTAVADCSAGGDSISFVESSTRTTTPRRVSYYFRDGSLWRTIDGYSEDEEKLLPNGVMIDDTASQFIVNGTQTLMPANVDTAQPTVTIIMVLAETAETEATTLQTTITQRSLDI